MPSASFHAVSAGRIRVAICAGALLAAAIAAGPSLATDFASRSGERRVGEEGGSRGAPDHLKKKKNSLGHAKKIEKQALGVCRTNRLTYPRTHPTDAQLLLPPSHTSRSRLHTVGSTAKRPTCTS